MGSGTSRNMACPCGSGRKTKHCHGGLEFPHPDMTSSGFLDSAKEAIDRLQSFGLNGRKRIGKYVEWLSSPKTPETVKDRAKAFEAYSQLGQLVMVERAAERLQSREFRQALSKISRGGYLQETDDDIPRDTLLELVVAAVFADAGFDVELTTNAEDLRIDVPGLGWGIAECKRPRHRGTMLKNAREAVAQIGKRIRTDPSIQFGVPVLGLDLVMMPLSQPHAARNEKELDDALENEKARLINELTEGLQSESLQHFGYIPFGALSVSGAFFLKEESAMIVTTMFSHFVMGRDRFTKLPPPLEKLFTARQSLYLSDLRRRVRGNFPG